MYKKIRGFLVIALSLMFVFGNCLSASAHAERELPSDGGWTETDVITEEHTVQYYKITLPADGKLEITLQSWMNYVSYKFWDADLTKTYLTGELKGGSENEPAAELVVSSYLKEGTYYFEVCQFTDYTGTSYTNTGEYRIKAGFTDGETNETEPNDKAPEGILLEPGTTITGMMWEDDEYDYYILNLEKPQTVRLMVKSWMDYINMGIRDADFMEAADQDGKAIKDIEISGGSEKEPKSQIFEYSLNKGTWYIFFKKFTGYTGTSYRNDGIYSLTLMDENAEE